VLKNVGYTLYKDVCSRPSIPVWIYEWSKKHTSNKDDPDWIYRFRPDSCFSLSLSTLLYNSTFSKTDTTLPFSFRPCLNQETGPFCRFVK
jgi:hypothetical protein